jgi:hypothetical protein
MTNVALSAMLGATPPQGYESLYFDRNAGELRGGIRKYIGRRTPDKIPSSYMDDLDYQEPLAFEFLIYVAPERVWRTDMQRFRERFRTAPQNRDYRDVFGPRYESRGESSRKSKVDTRTAGLSNCSSRVWSMQLCRRLLSG